MTVAEMIKAAARAKGAIDRYNDLDAAEYAEGLSALNSMLALWSSEGITIYNDVADSFTLTPGKGTYTIGTTGADVTTTRPTGIHGAFIRTANNLDIPVEVITREEYSAITDKSASGEPAQLFYSPTMGAGTIYLSPVPILAETLHFQSQRPMANFASIEDEINLPPETEEAIKYNLSLRVCPEVPPTALVASLAASGKSAIYTVPVAPATFDAAVISGGRYDITRG